MLVKIKDSCSYKRVSVVIHEKCLILIIDGNNKLYDFNSADKMINNLKQITDNDSIIKIKSYVMDNCSKVFFTDKKNKSDQLSLF